MPIFEVIVGVALVALILIDVFEAIVLPRRVSRPYRPARFFYRVTWWVWVVLADRMPWNRIRKALLGEFGPMSLFGLFALWAIGLIIGFGLIHHAVAPVGRSLADSMYLSGTTFTTLGYGDVNPSGLAGRTLSVVEALVGFGSLAVVIGFLPVFYQAFSLRERTISLLDARAGSPPIAGQMLLRLPVVDGDALDRFMREAEIWAAGVLESHLSYPVLNYYRSQHDNQSWLATLTCTLDVSALILTVVDGADRQQARLTFAMARHALVDLSLVLQRPPTATRDRLDNEQLHELLQTLQTSGIKVRDDESAHLKLTELRALYEPFAHALATYLRLELPQFWKRDVTPDNWQTSAWARRAAGFRSLGIDPSDEHHD